MAVQVLGKVAYFNKGAYNSQTNYEINDVVSYNGSSYVSLNDNNQGNLPTNTNYWSVVAEKGDKGDTGKPFVIEKTYSTIESMVADYDNMNVNDYVMIQGSIEEQENATLWTKREVEVSPYKWAYLADFSGASGITGATPNIHIGNVTEGNEPSVTRRSGSSNENPILDFVLKTGAKGDTGATGNGISSIEKTSTSGLVDTYTITFTNGTTTTFDVDNGRGIVSIVKTGSVDNVDTYTISYNDNTTSTFEVANSEVTEEEFDDVVNELNYLYDDLPKVEGEGTSLTLDNTRKGKMSNVLRGNTSQYTTTGKNLYDVYDVYLRGDNFSEDEDDFTTYQQTGSTSSPIYKADYKNVSNKLQTSHDYWALIEIKEVSYTGTAPTMAFFTNINVGDYGQFSTGVSYNFDQLSNGQKIKAKVTTRDDFSDCTCLARKIITYKAGTTSAKLVYRISILDEEPDVSTFEYEPFTNNEPSPNPDYPQDVHVVSGDNTIIVEGKNLAKENIISNGRYNFLLDSIELEANKTYTFSFIPTNNNIGFNIKLNSINGTIIKQYQGATKDQRYTTTFTLNENGKLFINNYANSFHAKDIMIEQNNQATAYTPYYVSQTYPITLPIGTELCKIGDYQDSIVKDNGKWYLNKQIGKVIFNGSENWNNSFGTNLFNIADYFSDKPFIVGYGLSNYYKYNSIQSGIDNGTINGEFVLQKSTSDYNILIKNTDYSTPADFKMWLSTHNTVVYYPLATPTNTEITDQTLIAQLDNFEKAISYNTQTNISQENNDLPFIISASAFMSLKYLFGNLETRVAELETSEPSEL